MSTRGDGETVNVRRATVADVATISALNADVQAVHAAALPWLFKTPSAETFPPATAAACSQEMMSWFTSPTSVMSRWVTRTHKSGGIQRHPCSTPSTRSISTT